MYCQPPLDTLFLMKNPPPGVRRNRGVEYPSTVDDPDRSGDQ